MTTTLEKMKRAKRKAHAPAAEKLEKSAVGSAAGFASLSPDLLGRDENVVLTRPDAIVYSQSSAEAAAALQQAPRVAVTFRMEKTEFVRLRHGAQMIGVKPRDVVHRAIKNCLDAYGVRPEK